ncbi:MAG: 50S ribosomal protein L10 [Chloroflexi bacterium]|nr:MAG: 50S ribosomal protein L10 [Chloroflexota bacterium]
MAISKARKEELVAQYTELINQSEAIILTEFSAMPVKVMEDLRGEVRKADGAFYVTKNTLLRLALEKANRPLPEDLLSGQTATGFALNEPPTLAKAIVNFAKDHEQVKIKGGLLGDKVLTAEDVEALAKLPTLDELRAQIIGLINAPAQNIVSVVANGVRQVVNVIDAYAKSEESAEAAS